MGSLQSSLFALESLPVDEQHEGLADGPEIAAASAADQVDTTLTLDEHAGWSAPQDLMPELKPVVNQPSNVSPAEVVQPAQLPYNVVLGAHGHTPQYGILGEISGRKVAFD
jgi:hypothetical protein